LREKEIQFSNRRLRKSPRCNENSVIMRNKMKSIMHKLVALPISLSIAFAVSLQGTTTPRRIKIDHRQLFSPNVEELRPEYESPKNAQDIASNDRNETITAFDKEHIYFDGKEENCNKGRKKDNCRIATDTVSFPNTDKSYEKVTMRLKLECPNQKCDDWDRSGYVAVVKGGKQIELMRFMTPYGVGGEWSLDVTSLQPLLKEDVQFELFIDTWVKAGHSDGDGWLATVSFDFEGSSTLGQPVPVEVIPLWNEQNLVVGDPNKPISGKIAPVSVSIPADASRVELRSLITGHGQGNTEFRNPKVSSAEDKYHGAGCAEWCSLEHTYSIGQTKFPKVIWRDNCSTTAVQNQGGSAPFASRSGWCPGDIVYPWVENVPVSDDAAKRGATVDVNYEIEEYINKENTGYDGSNHTEPFYRTSAVLVIYK